MLDKPVIQYVVEEALEPEEVDDAIIVTSPGKPELLNYFQPDRSLENLLRERGKNAYADAVAHAGGMPVDFRYQYEPRASAMLFALLPTPWQGRTSWFFWATTLCLTAISATRCSPFPRSTVRFGYRRRCLLARGSQPLRCYRRRARRFARGRRGRCRCRAGRCLAYRRSG